MTRYKRLKAQIKELEKEISKKDFYSVIFLSSPDGASVNIRGSGRDNKVLDVTVSNEDEFLDLFNNIEAVMAMQKDFFDAEEVQEELGERIVIGSLWHDILTDKYHFKGEGKETDPVVFIEEIPD